MGAVQLNRDYSRIAALEAEIEALKEELRQYREMFAPIPNPPACLSRGHRGGDNLMVRIASMLARAGTVRRSALMCLSEADTSDNVISVVVSQLRRRLRPFGIEIHTQLWNNHTRGLSVYRVSPDHQVALRKLLGMGQ